MYFVKTPGIAHIFYRDLVWSIPGNEQKIYLTFDDGPDNSTTPRILDILNEHEINATFFCVGDKAKKHNKIIERIIAQRHSIGNHSYSHLKGTKVKTEDFIQDVEKCNEVIHSKLFRPPYGKLTRQQTRLLKEKYKIVMWSVLPGDFDDKVSKESCLIRSIKNTTKGTIIVFHDNLKTIDKVTYVLPKYIEHFKNLGFTFEPLEENLLQ